MHTENEHFSTDALQRIADALERAFPPHARDMDWRASDAYVWHSAKGMSAPVSRVSFLPLELLLGIEQQRDTLLANTRQFAQGYSANNALLWGARGMGKSSLVKSLHAAINAEMPHSLMLIEIHREDIDDLPRLLRQLQETPRRAIIFCDDLSFDGSDASYKSLKAALEGGIEGRPDNVLLYATSNRRHLMPREMIENERSTAIHASEATEEKISLSDRFGLWLGFHPCNLDGYLAIVDTYARHYGIELPKEDLHQQAFQWASARGARSGRVAWQFIQHLAGRMGVRLA